MSQDPNATFAFVRKTVFVVASVFAFLELALGSAITNWTSTNFFGSYFSFAALGIATGILTFLTLPVLLFLSIKRQNAITSMVAIELGWTWFLWIMWLSTAGSAASVFWITDCTNHFDSEAETICREVQAFTAFGFLTWIILFAYNILLMVLVIRQHMRGNTSVWTVYIMEVDFAASGPLSGSGIESKASPSFAPQYPPTQVDAVNYAGPPVMTPQPTTTSPYPQV